MTETWSENYYEMYLTQLSKILSVILATMHFSILTRELSGKQTRSRLDLASCAAVTSSFALLLVASATCLLYRCSWCLESTAPESTRLRYTTEMPAVCTAMYSSLNCDVEKTHCTIIFVVPCSTMFAVIICSY